MLISAIVEIFKYKLASTIFVLSCWSSNERLKFMRRLMVYNVRATISCDAKDILPQPNNHQLHGILYFTSSNITDQVERSHFGYWYKWVIVGDELPPFLNATRYDADVVLVTPTANGELNSEQSFLSEQAYNVNDVYIHPAENPSIHPWACWNTKYRLQIKYEQDRLLRRWNLKQYTLKIATPLGTYSNEIYTDNGAFKEYLLDMSMPERDSGIRTGYMMASLMLEALNASEEMVPTLLWGTEVSNSSMILKLRMEAADIAGGILRIMRERVDRLDYVVPLWPFHVGFTYLAERESSSNMFVEPFTAGVWWCCLGLFVILALAQRITAKSPIEKEGAYIAVLATSLQQEQSFLSEQAYNVNDVYIHPAENPSIHPWACWNTKYRLQIKYEQDRLLRRWNLKQYTLKIATPLGTYSNEIYTDNGAFKEYLLDMSMPERDSGIRTGYMMASLMLEALNASEEMVPTLLWGTEVSNSSMILKLRMEAADIAGGILRIMRERVDRLDYVVPLWPFHVGFTYLAERESSSNMFVEPFTAGVWWCCLGLFVILALAQRITAKSPIEKEGAYIAVLATSLQQDASAVPEGISGRWTFVVLSISGMLIHAYYTSAIVSALMSTGRDGPKTLRALGDSKYAIASEDYDYMRFFMFDVQSNWSDMEYLKEKKMTAKFYFDIHRGAKLIQSGQTAYHTEYNQLYPHLRYFTDDEVCKIQHVDTIPESLSWLTTTRFGQWKNIFRVIGGWLHETGLKTRLVRSVRIQPPPCQAALLAEKVNISDIAPAIIITITGMVASVVILGFEVLYRNLQGRNRTSSAMAFVRSIQKDDYNE